MEEALPNRKMTEKDKIPRKPKGQSSHKLTKKDRKSPPKTIARKRNMDSDDSEFEVKDPDRDDILEGAQHGTFGKKRPDFANLKSDEENLKPLEKEKEEGEIQTAHDKDAGLYSHEEYKAWTETNKDEFLKVKAHVHYRAYAQESV